MKTDQIRNRSASSAAEVRGHLLRVLGVGFGLAVIIGNTIGAGIFRAPGTIAEQLPSAGPFLLVWISGALIPALDGKAAGVAAAVTIFFAILQWRGIVWGSNIQNVTSLLKALAFLALIVAAFVLGSGGALRNAETHSTAAVTISAIVI